MCVDRWTEDNGKKGVSVAVFLCYAGRLRYAGHLLRAYVAMQRTLAPVTVRRHDSTATTIKARGDIIAYRRSGLVQRRAAVSVSAVRYGHLRCVPDATLTLRNRHRRGVWQSLILSLPDE